MNNNKLQPAIIGGVVLGVLSAIPFIKTCCCLYAIAGGILATYLYIKRAPYMSYADGAMLGAIAGGVGSVIYIILGVPLSIMAGKASASMLTNLIQNANPEQAEIVRQQIEAAQNQSFIEQLPQAILFAILVAIFLSILSTLGGLLGVPLFQSRKGGGASTTPPPNYGGTTGGYGGADYASPPPNFDPAPPPVAPPNFNDPPTGSSGSGL
ncbi:MAG: hypothetical protein ACR2LC_17565 [Pyrinomonadaceae bacterium]